LSQTRYTLVAQVLEAAINKALAYDPGTEQALASLDTKVLALHVTAPDTHWFVHIQNRSVAIYNQWEGTVDCKITGTLPALAALAAKDTTSLANTDVYIEGNPGVLTQVQNLLKTVDIDWELALSKHIGPTPAHLLSELLRAKHQWVRERAKALPSTVAHYLTEEAKLLPTAYEVQTHYQAIQTLRADTARLEARIAQLSQAAQSYKTKGPL